MRKLILTGLAASLIAPAGAWAQEPPPLPADGPPLAGDAVSPGPDSPRDAPDLRPDGPQPGDRAPPPPEDRQAQAPTPQPGQPAPPPKAQAKAKPAEKPKLDEAAGGVAGGVLANVAGTAVAGPVGGIAASMVGSRVGSGAVRVTKKVLGIGKKPDKPPVQEAAAAPEAAHDAAAVAPIAEPPGPVLREEPPADAAAIPIEPEAPAPS